MVRSDFVNLAEHQTLMGYSRGIELFIESLNEEMERDEILREHSLDDVINIMVADHIKKNY